MSTNHIAQFWRDAFTQELYGLKMKDFVFDHTRSMLKCGSTEIRYTGNMHDSHGRLRDRIEFILWIHLVGQSFRYVGKKVCYTHDPFYAVEDNLRSGKYNIFLGQLLSDARKHPEYFVYVP